MSATKFVLGQGSVFSISTDGTTFTTVNQLKTVSFSGTKLDTEDITNMSSPNSTREFAPTLLDSGQVSLSGVFNPHDAGQLSFAAAFNAITLLTCKLVFPVMTGDTTAFTREFTGYVTEYTLSDAFDKSATLSATIKISGVITDTVPS